MLYIYRDIYINKKKKHTHTHIYKHTHIYINIYFLHLPKETNGRPDTGSSELIEDLTKSTYTCTHMRTYMYVCRCEHKCMRNIELYWDIFPFVLNKGCYKYYEYEYSPRLSSTINANFITKILKHLLS